MYFDLSIADSNTLTECKWCVADDPAGFNIFFNDFQGNKQKTKQNGLRLVRSSPVINNKARNPQHGCPPLSIIMVLKKVLLHRLACI